MPSATTLADLLALVGHLDDGPGFDTPRDRFRRYITTRLTDTDGVRHLLHQCQETLGDQTARARQDLVVSLGRFLGFDVTFGPYGCSSRPTGGAGQWRSPEMVHLAIEIRSERTLDSEVDVLARTLEELRSGAATGGDHWVGLTILTPFYVLRRPLEEMLALREPRDIRSVSIESLLWLAETAGAGRLEREEVMRLLTSGPDSDFMIDLMRRLTARRPSPGPGPVRGTGSGVSSGVGPAPKLTIVARPETERPRCWAAVITQDDSATPEQVLDGVVRRRHLLGVCSDGGAAVDAQIGDRVCLLIPELGAVGHAVIDSVVAEPWTVLRDANRFSAVFRLKTITILDRPTPVPAGSEARRISDRVGSSTPGAILAPLAAPEFDALVAPPDGRHAIGS